MVCSLYDEVEIKFMDKLALTTTVRRKPSSVANAIAMQTSIIHVFCDIRSHAIIYIYI